MTQTNKTQSNNPVAWFDIYVDDLARAQTFYENVFQKKLEDMSDPSDDAIQMRAFGDSPDAYGAMGALVKMTGMEPGKNSTVVYFACEDCATEQARALESGGNVLKEKFSIGDFGFISLVMDTEGNVIGLHSNK